MNATFRAMTAAAMLVAVFGVAVAKLPPAPPLTDEQKAAKKAKDDAAADKAKQEVARAEDRVVARYLSEQKAKGVTVTPQVGPASSAATSAPAAAAPAPAGTGNVVIGPPGGAPKAPAK